MSIEKCLNCSIPENHCHGIDNCFEEKQISARALEWLSFSDSVMEHVEKYTVPQYGDKGKDNVSEWSAEECFKQVEKYLKRRKTNQRLGQNRLDILKAAHYLCLAEAKLEDDNRHGLV